MDSRRLELLMLLTAVLVINVSHDCQCQYTCLYTRCPIKCTFVSILATLIKMYNLMSAHMVLLIHLVVSHENILFTSYFAAYCSTSSQKNRETPSILPWQVPDNNTVFVNGNCIGILMISRLFCTPEDLSDNGVPFLSVDMIPSHTTFQGKCRHWSHNRDDVL